MIELDFLFIYEHKVRELENLCLMKYELDKRGYRTKIIYVDDAKNALEDRPIYYTKVLCTMACYDNYTLYWHTKEFVKFDKVIDLQWENIVYEKDENREGAYKNYWGIGKDVVHVSWGNQNVNRLLNVAHLDNKKVKLTGHVGMDFLKEPLSRYYLSKEELYEKYNLPMNKKVILFASPYFGDSLPDGYIQGMCKSFGEDWLDYYEFMCKSQKVVLQWFEKICTELNDTIIIFRPHPGHPSRMAEQLQKKCINFRIIAEESVKQWILACDKVYTGNSSVVVEAFFAKKMCQLLFPFPITPGFELKLISDSKKITTYEEFYRSVLADKEEFPVPQKNIEEIYLVDWEKPNYIKFADMAEEVLKDDYYRLTKRQLWNYREYTPIQCLVRLAVAIKPLYNLYLSVLEHSKCKWKLIEHQRAVREKTRELHYNVERQHAHELASEEEITGIIDRIKNAIEN